MLFQVVRQGLANITAIIGYKNVRCASISTANDGPAQTQAKNVTGFAGLLIVQLSRHKGR